MEGMSSGTSSLNAAVNVVRELQKEHSTNPHDSLCRLTASENSSIPFEISPEEESRLLSDMRQLALEKKKLHVADADTFWLLAALRARKGNAKRAVALASNYLEWRAKVDYDKHTPTSSPIVKEIMSAGLFVLAGNVSRDGRPVLTIRYRFFDPRRFSAMDTARAFGFIVEWMLRTYPTAQTHGMVVVEDAAGFSMKNFDIRLISFLEKAFSSILPARVSALHVTNPGFLIRAMFALFSSFFSDKLKARIRLFGKGEEDKFGEFFDKDQNLAFLNFGGTMQWSPAQQEGLTHRLLTDAQEWAPATTYQP